MSLDWNLAAHVAVVTIVVSWVGTATGWW